MVLRMAKDSRETFLVEFHRRHPGITSRAFHRAGSYARLAGVVSALAPSGRILDLACGDGTLLRCLAERAAGLDLSAAELSRCAGLRVVRGRAQAMPFADHAFDVVACHLAFMLFDDVDRVVSELARVTAPGGSFVALLGGGPVALASDDPPDAFHQFLALARPRSMALGDARARSEAGWRALFPRWHVAPFERWELDLGGAFDDVWAFLSACYEPFDREPIERELRASHGSSTRVPCRAVTWLARATLMR